MNNNFFPEGYDKIPSNSRYMRLLDGENTFRVLSSAITGWSYWNTQNKPVRLKERPDEMPHDIRIESDGKQAKVKHFWAFVVWNYDQKMVQILEVTQAQIQSAMKALVDSKHWGDPKKYDIAISRSGTGFDTEYVVQGIPPKPLDMKTLAEYKKMDIKLEGLFTGEDPFGAPKPAVPPPVPMDGPEYQEPTIVQEKPIVEESEGPRAAAIPDRYKNVPPAFRPTEKTSAGPGQPLA